MKLFFIRYTKMVFTFLRLHKFFNLFSGFNLNMVYLSRFSSWAAKNRKIAGNDFPSKWNYQKRYGLYKNVLKDEDLASVAINYLEFGVAQGHSMSWFVQENANAESRFYGFDTFTGLPEDFGTYKKGAFNSNNK